MQVNSALQAVSECPGAARLVFFFKSWDTNLLDVFNKDLFIVPKYFEIYVFIYGVRTLVRLPLTFMYNTKKTSTNKYQD